MSSDDILAGGLKPAPTILLLVLFLVVPARAQDDPAPSPGTPLLDLPRADRDVRGYLARADRAAADGNLLEACQLYDGLVERAVDETAVEVVPDEEDPSRAFGLRAAIVRRLAAASPPLRERWEETVGPVAGDRATRAAAARDVEGLVSVCRRFPLTEGAGRAAGRLLALALERGDPLLAGRAVRFGAEPGRPPAADLLRLAWLARVRGRTDRARDLARRAAGAPDRDEVLVLGGTERSVTARAGALIEDLRPAGLRVPAGEPEASVSHRSGRPAGGPRVGPAGTAVALRERIVLVPESTPVEPRAIPVEGASGRGTVHPGRRTAVVLVRRRDEGSETPGVPYPFRERGELVGVDLEGGRTTWRTGDGEAGPPAPSRDPLERASAVAPAEPAGSALLTVLFTPGGEYHVVALDRDDGRTLWRSRLALAGTEIVRHPAAVRAGIRVAGGRALVWLDPGLVGALDPADGTVLWLRRLPLPTPEGSTHLPSGLAGRSLRLRRFRHAADLEMAGPLRVGHADGETAVLVPSVLEPGVVCAVDLREGNLRWTTRWAATGDDPAIRDLRPLPSGEVAVVDGRGGTYLLDPRTGRRRSRSIDLGGAPAGAGAGAGEGLLVPLEGAEDAAVAVLRRVEGEPPSLEVVRRVPVDEGEVGGLARMGAWLISAGRRRVTVRPLEETE